MCIGGNNSTVHVRVDMELGGGACSILALSPSPDNSFSMCAPFLTLMGPPSLPLPEATPIFRRSVRKVSCTSYPPPHFRPLAATYVAAFLPFDVIFSSRASPFLPCSCQLYPAREGAMWDEAFCTYHMSDLFFFNQQKRFSRTDGAPRAPSQQPVP